MGCFSSPSQSVTPTSTQSPAQQALMKQMIGMVSPNIGGAGDYYQGQTVADLSGLQQQGIDMAGQIPGMVGQSQGMGFDALQNIMSGDAQRDSAQNFFENTVTPNVMGTFANTSSANSGMAQKALAQAGGDVSLGLANSLAGQQMQGIQQIPGLSNMTGQGASQLQTLGQLPYQQQQAQLNAQQSIWNQQQPLNNPYFSTAGQLAGMGTIENIGTNNSAGLGSTLLGGMMGGVGQGFGGAMASMF